MDTQLLPYRLKSARRKKRLQLEDRDKQLLKLNRELKRIQKHPEFRKTVDLDEPYQKGWNRLFVLKPEIARSDKAEFYQGILYKINQVQYHYDKSFKKPKRKGRWHKYYFDDLPKLQRIEERYWQTGKTILTDEQCACFQKVQYWDETHYRWDYYREFIFPEVFEIAVLPNMITTVKIGDVILKQRESFIGDYLYTGKPAFRLAKLRGGYYKYWRSWYYIEKKKYVHPFKNKPQWDWGDE
jgi:hypothetical protein